MSDNAARPDSQDDIVEALVAQVEANFGAHLDDSARTQVRRQCADIAANSAALAAWPLVNGDEPATILTPTL